MTAPFFKTLLLTCVFLVFSLTGCNRQSQPQPDPKQEQLRREQEAKEAQYRREKAAREAAEKAAKNAEISKNRWQLSFFLVSSAMSVVLVIIATKRISRKQIVIPSRLSIGPRSDTVLSINRSSHEPTVPWSTVGLSHISGPVPLSNVLPIQNPVSTPARSLNILPIVSTQQVKGIYIIDGLNVARSYHGDQIFRIETLVTLCITLREAGDTFLCVFDATAKYVARETKDPVQSEIYNKLVTAYDRCFSEVTGGIQADDFILLRAEKINAKVISNDRFIKPDDNHVQLHPWVLDPHRLIKGRVMGCRLTVPGLAIDVPIVNDIYAATRLLYKLTAKENAA